MIEVRSDDALLAQSVADALANAGIEGVVTGSITEAAGEECVVIAAPSNADALPHAEAMAQQLWSTQTPCVVRMPDDTEADDPAFERIAASDAVAVSASDDAAGFVAAVRTLVAAGAKVRDLRKQLTVADRLSQGMSKEMDRLQDELQLAAPVQRESLPHEMPTTNGLEIAVLYRPQGFLSGDTYDVLRVDDKTLGVFIADAVGHGAPAALMTMVLARSLQTHGRRDAPEEPLEPTYAMARLNGALTRRTRATSIRFATAAYLTIDEPTGGVIFASAGHPHALVYSGGELNREVESQGPMLGVFAGADFPESETVLAPGETLVVHSDGFEQVFGDEATEGDQRGYRNAFAGLCASHPGTLDERMRGLTASIDERAGSLHQVDDLTLIAITRTDTT